MQQSIEYTIANSVTPKAITSSTDATPIVVTATAHGLVTGDTVLIYGHTTNVAANGIYKVTRLTADTFSLQNRNTGASVAGSGAGAGSGGILIPNPKILRTDDFRNCSFTLDTAGSATISIGVAMSNGLLLEDESGHGDVPNFGSTLSDTNPYVFVNVVDLLDGSSLPGNTGIPVTGTDFHKGYEVNTNLQKYLCIFPISWTQGSYSIKAMLSNNVI